MKLPQNTDPRSALRHSPLWFRLSFGGGYADARWPLYLVVLEEDGRADGIEEDSIWTPAEFVAQRIV
jgi:hypothetical protein